MTSDEFKSQPCSVCQLPLGDNVLVHVPASDRGWMHGRCYDDKVALPPMTRTEVEELIR